MEVIIDEGNGNFRFLHFTENAMIHEHGPGEMIRIADENKQYYFNPTFIIAIVPSGTWRF